MHFRSCRSEIAAIEARAFKNWWSLWFFMKTAYQFALSTWLRTGCRSSIDCISYIFCSLSMWLSAKCASTSVLSIFLRHSITPLQHMCDSITFEQTIHVAPTESDDPLSYPQRSSLSCLEVVLLLIRHNSISMVRRSSCVCLRSLKSHAFVHIYITLTPAHDHLLHPQQYKLS